ncbi:hypothetical protein [Micromonospora cathayae]|uniref:SH3 domain-containing protein n=1 Tax=Micromonospora cathayae TaxID=3028804 RepID=A0ABY7ZS27_9ACTN|nr:hypothetical protein [Micromonospora sp. HUAS 3]WDZ85576.1 hypothetical protein PVK37_03730 [Micromonospora sp. HUAS 3]
MQKLKRGALAVVAAVGFGVASGTAPASAAPATVDTAAPGISSAAATTSTANPGVTPLAWYKTTALGGPIRTCYSSSCDIVVYTYDGEPIHWSHYAYNSAGNRWYYVKDSFGYTGWTYCGNVTAPC